jgi:hypothetical protein
VGKMLEEGFSCFALEGDALNIINPLDCSLVLPYCYVTDIIGYIRFKLSFVIFWLFKFLLNSASKIRINHNLYVNVATVSLWDFEKINK